MLLAEMARNIGYALDCFDVEEEKRKAFRVLEENANRYNKIIQTSLDGVWMLDLEGRILEVNDAYLKRSGYGEEPAWFSQELSNAGDMTPVIVNAALDEERPCELCAGALDQFVSILGAEAGNLALKVLATGGVYIGGGIAPRILPFLQKEIFMESFRDKGRYTQLMEKIPVHVILNPDVALLGAAGQALER